jgi:hypothetical protein
MLKGGDFVMYAVISLKSGRNTGVDNLMYLIVRDSFNGSETKITDFSTFRILPEYEVTFVGKNSTFVFTAGEIAYVEFRQ